MFVRWLPNLLAPRPSVRLVYPSLKPRTIPAMKVARSGVSSDHLCGLTLEVCGDKVDKPVPSVAHSRRTDLSRGGLCAKRAIVVAGDLFPIDADKLSRVHVLQEDKQSSEQESDHLQALFHKDTGTDSGDCAKAQGIGVELAMWLGDWRRWYLRTVA